MDRSSQEPLMSLVSKLATTSLLAAVAILGVACEGDAERTVPVTPTASPTTGTDATGRAPMPTGETFVFVRGIEGGALILDPALFLSGDEALVAAREDGFIEADEDLPNDFYVRNLERESLIVSVADGSIFTLIGFDAGGGLVDVEIDGATLEALLSGDDASAYYGFVPTELPMTLMIEDGEVTGGRQHYLP